MYPLQGYTHRMVRKLSARAMKVNEDIDICLMIPSRAKFQSIKMFFVHTHDHFARNIL